jgi:maltooligosyltrehalose trehalohydrolase
VEVNFDQRGQWFVVKRGDVEVICNLASDRRSIPISITPKTVLCSEEEWRLGPGVIELPSDSVAMSTSARAQRDHQSERRTSK